MSPGNVVIPPPPPLSDFQRRALTLYIKKKRTHYEKKDAVISRKYRWLEDLNQRDPDLEGIEISESSLEELKKKRESLCDEKHRLFDQLKNLLPATEEEEQPASQFPGQPGLYPGNPQTVYPGNPQGAYLTPQPGYQPPYHISSGYPTGSNFHPTNYGPPFSSTPYSVITEPVTPKKPSEMSPVQIMKPSDMSPLSSHERTGYNRSWDNVSPVSKTADSESVEFNRYPSTEYTTPSAATKYAETRENRIDSFTKAFTDTISKAMMSEMNMSKESASKSDPKPNPRSSPLKPPEPTPTTPSKTEPLLSPKHKPKETPEPKKTEPAVRPRSPDITRKSEIKPAEVSKRSEGKQTEARRVEHTSGNKSRKSISGTESNSSVSSLKHPSQSPQLKQRKEEVSDLPPVIKISKAEIHSKVMSWPTSHPFPRKAADRTPDSEKKPAGKKESADSSGSSLLEFAFQSALFGNTLFGDKEASPTPPQGPKTPPSTTSQGPSDLLTALSMSYGSGPPRKQPEKQGDEKRDQSEKTRKRERSPDARSPSPELVQVYKSDSDKPEEKKEEEKGKEGEKKTTPPPPPPPPPPPKSGAITPGGTKKVVASPATPSMSYAPCSPSTSTAIPSSSVPYSSFHPPLSFLSPTHPGAQYSSSQFSSPLHKSPSLRSPMCNPYTGPPYPPHSPRLGMLPPPPVQPPMAGLPPPHMPPLPPPHLLHPPHKNRNFPSSRYL